MPYKLCLYIYDTSKIIITNDIIVFNFTFSVVLILEKEGQRDEAKTVTKQKRSIQSDQANEYDFVAADEGLKFQLMTED
jgi:hypothetical protein